MGDAWAGARRWLRGIRVRVVVWYLGLFAVLLAVALLTIREVLLVRLEDEVGASLAQEAEELRLLAGGVDPRTGEPFGADVAALFDTFLDRNLPAPDEVLLAVIDGQVHRASPETTGRQLVTDELLEVWQAPAEPTWGESSSSQGDIRWLSVPVEAGADAPPARFVVVDLIGDARADVDDAVRVMAAISALVLLLATVLGYATTGRVLAPIRRVTRTARHISDDELTARIPVEGDDELAELTRTFNEMLDRLEAAFGQQRRFMDDVGHELRTPITIVRGHLEVFPDDPDERAEAIATCLDELDRMGRYVRDLITLAKAERPDFLQFAEVDVAELTDGLERRAVALAPDRRWIIERIAPVTVVGDADRLNQALVNLVSNAAQHTAPDDEIRLGSDVVGREVHIWVSDPGPGIAPDERTRIFERFGRGGDTTRRTEGVGLGLAIVSAVAQAHGGRIDLDSRPGHGARFTLVLPYSPPRAGTEVPVGEESVLP